jgi:hypothetical protein
MPATSRLSRTRYDLLGACAAGLVVLLFCLLLLRHDGHVFWYDDYQLSILPVFADVARSWSEGNWPLLSPYSWVCSNLAGEFQYGTFSVFVNAAVVVIWRFHLDFAQQAAALSIVHLIALGMGGYMLARGRDLAPPLALMVALVAALNGWIIAWGASDWFGALAAFAWLPGSWWALERAASPGESRARVLLPSVFIYLLVAGGFPYTVLMLVGVTAWLALRVLATRRDWSAVVRLAIGWALGLGLSAPAWIALLDYAPGSRRAVEVLPTHQWMVPFSALPALIVPSWTVPWHIFGATIEPHTAVELACGLAPTVILIAACAAAPRVTFSKLRWDFSLLIAVLAVCMLPSAGMFRFSFRSLALFHVVLALTAAEAYAVSTAERKRIAFGMWAIVCAGVVGAAAYLIGATTTGASLLPLFAIVAVLWAIGGAIRLDAAWMLPLVTFVSLLATYLTMPPHGPVTRYGLDANLNDVAPLDPDRLYLSLYRSPPENYGANKTGGWFGTVTRPGSISMFAGAHLINGYSPVGPAGIARLLDAGTHGHINPARLNQVVLSEAGPDGLLAKLGIDGILIASDFPMPARLPDNWHSVFGSWEGEVWHRDVSLPHVRALADEHFASANVTIIENSRQRVLADVTSTDLARPVLLVFSRPYFAGYRATLDGKPLPVTSMQGLAPTVELPSGASGRVELVYRPRAVTLGGGISALSLLAALGALPLLRRADRR